MQIKDQLIKIIVIKKIKNLKTVILFAQSKGSLLNIPNSSDCWHYVLLINYLVDEMA